MTIEFLHDASGVLAVAKPAGIPTQAPPGIISVESLLREQLFGEAVITARASGQRRHPGGFLGVPHRLDRPVSGVLLVATTPRAARQLSRQFERRHIGKSYLAVVSMSPQGAMGIGHTFEWRDMIRKVPDAPRAEIVPGGIAGGHEAHTRGRVLAARDDKALVVLEPLTGRMHQLRVQAASRGMPILGDTMYGGTPRATDDDRSSPISLHAWRIRFRDPDTGSDVDVSCPLPPGTLWDAWTAIISND